jgi:O-acetyl-ADP-ribose deacetylase (regulator of RNase III)
VGGGGGGGEPETLARCYRKCLALAMSHGFASLAFPSISTGAFGYPVDAAAAVALGAAREVLTTGSSLDVVRFVLFSDADLKAYRAALEGL